MSCLEWSLSVQHILLPKKGLLATECEDAIGVRRDTQRFCVADGATEAYDSGRWARLLTKHWVSNTQLLTVEELGPWIQVLGERLEKRWAKKPLPWYAEEKARGGAFASLVGLAFFPSGETGQSWKAIAIGDSCLVQKRGTAIVQALPISDPDAFGFHPTLIPSNPAKQARITQSFTIAEGHSQSGDIFLLLTDAIAAWYLRMCSEDPSQAMELERLLETDNPLGIKEMISSLRDQRRLHNDDIAIIRILVCSRHV